MVKFASRHLGHKALSMSSTLDKTRTFTSSVGHPD
jgi:hypothetical protein